MFRSCAAIVVAVLALAGCSSALASMPKGVGAATPSLPCSLPYGTHVALLLPAPGSAGVTAGEAPLLVVASRDLPKTVTVVATDSKGAASPSDALERTSPPAHAGRAPFPDPVYYRAPGLALRAHRHYTLALDDVAENGCAPYAPLLGNARFST